MRWVSKAVLLIGLATLAAAPGEARAQSANDLDDLRVLVKQLHDEGKYTTAIPIAERYVSLARQKFSEDSTEYALAISWLASVYQAQGRTAEAEPLYKRALAVREKARGPEHPDVATDLNNLARLYRAQGRYSEAEPLYKRALAIREKVDPDGPPRSPIPSATLPGSMASRAVTARRSRSTNLPLLSTRRRVAPTD
jgi:tetratricopeptide (TPR) repeat protein